MEVRYLKPADDRTAISNVYEKSWKYAYHNIIPQSFLDSIPEGQWVSHLEDSGRCTLLCVEDDIIVGTSSFGKSRSEELSDYGEVVSIYLLPEYMGKGYGKALLEAVMAELRVMGYRDVFLWVLEENYRARNFYERMGFLLTDVYLDDNIGGKDLREVRYVYHS